jgi:hypothetical protein
MRWRSGSGSQLVVSGVFTRAIQAATQTRPMAPVMANDQRQDSVAISQATIGALSAGPKSVPAWINPTARPRSELGAQSRTAR